VYLPLRRISTANSIRASINTIPPYAEHNEGVSDRRKITDWLRRLAELRATLVHPIPLAPK
jgi:hypothetical protein